MLTFGNAFGAQSARNACSCGNAGLQAGRSTVNVPAEYAFRINPAAGAQGAEILDHLPRPGDFRDQVFVQSERRRGGASPAAAPPVPANPSGV